MRISLRRAVATLRGRGGAAVRPGAAVAGRRRPGHTHTVLVVVLGVTLVGQATALLGAPAVSRASGESAVTAVDEAFTVVRVAAPPARRAAPPTTLVIPRIGVRSPLVRLGVQRDGTIETPKDYGQAGWYRAGARPGEPGPAVVVGHVDSTDGPAVFFRLRELDRGDRVRVRRTDGTVVTYAVTAVRTYPKSRFPTKAVYGATRAPTLRLVTCGGTFDTKSRSYRDNVVVFADLVTSRPAGGTR